jgi:UDPglucose 6-dehydrogenase
LVQRATVGLQPVIKSILETKKIGCGLNWRHNMKIIIAGYGYVGKAVDNAFKKEHEIIIIDPAYTDDKIKNHPDADGIIICVGTPSTDTGTCNGMNVLDVIDQTPVHIPIMIKSTISPDIVEILEERYTEHSIVISPEFLRARTSIEDFANQKSVIIGGDDPEYFWQELFIETLPNCKIAFKCSMKEASIIKYAANSFLALKTSFFNQLYDVCESSGTDFDIVRHIVSQDQRIGSDHTMVPGPDGERGWGGHCFPKDTLAYTLWARSINAEQSIIETAITYNNMVRKNIDKK